MATVKPNTKAKVKAKPKPKRKTDVVHTTPEFSGKQNLPKAFIERNTIKPEDNSLIKIIPTLENGMKNLRKSAWTKTALMTEIGDFFTYCSEIDLKPSKTGLRVFLGVSRTQYYAWETEPEKYDYISNLINIANDCIEMQYIDRLEKYPTGNIFLLKAKHGYIETSKLDITSDGKALGSSQEEVDGQLDRLGFIETE